jgi:hypothetical protein
MVREYEMPVVPLGSDAGLSVIAGHCAAAGALAHCRPGAAVMHSKIRSEKMTTLVRRKCD